MGKAKPKPTGQGPEKSHKSEKSQKPRKNKKFSRKRPANALLTLEDVAEIGGTQEDLDLLKGIDSGDGSDVEMDAAVKLPNDLMAEMMNIIGDAGVKGAVQVVAEKVEKTVEKAVEEKVVEDLPPSKTSQKKAATGDKLGADIAKIIGDKGIKTVKSDKVETVDSSKVAKSAQPPKTPVSALDSESSSDSDDDSTVGGAEATPHEGKIVWKYPVSSVENPNLPNRSLFTEDDFEKSWHDIVPHESGAAVADNTGVPISALKKAGMKLLENERELFKNKQGSNLDESIFDAGTLTDKVAIMCEQIEGSPLTSLTGLKELFEMIDSKARRKYLVALYGSETIKHVRENGQRVAKVAGFKTLLYDTGFLPREQRLRSFHEHALRPLEDMQTRKRNRLLALYAFEDFIKSGYARFCGSIIERMADSVVEVQKRSMRTAMEALCACPEQELTLLQALIDKFNSSDNKIAGYAQFLLNVVLEQHPVMQASIVQEVEQYIFTHAKSDKAKYYAITFFNQLVFDPEDSEIAVRVVLTYMKLFKSLISPKPQKSEPQPEKPAKKERWKNKQRPEKKKKEPEPVKKSGSMSAEAKHKYIRVILTGIGRAYPYAAKHQTPELKDALDDIFRLVYSPDFGICVRAVTLLVKMAKHGEDLDERLYNAVYQSFLHGKLGESSKHHSLYLNSVFQAISRDKNYPNRVKAMLKRLLSLANVTQSPFTAGVLVIAAVVLRQMENVRRASLKQIIIDPDNSSSEIKLEASLDGKFDSNSDNEDADASGGWVFSAVNNNSKTKKKLKSESQQKSENSDSESELSDDVALETKETSKSTRKVTMSSVKRSEYDASAWNPLHSGAQFTAMWEILALRRHFHPGVAHLADDLLNLTVREEYKGDPLEDFGVVKFLDRFAYKNPKPTKKREGNMAKFKKVVDSGLSKAEIMQVTSAEFVKDEAIIRSEDQYLQNFFKISRKGKKVKPKKEALEEELEDEEIGSDISDSEFDKLIAGDLQTGSKFDFIRPGGVDQVDDIDMSSDEELETIKKKEAEDMAAFEKAETETIDNADMDADSDGDDQNETADATAGTVDAIVETGAKKSNVKQKQWEESRTIKPGKGNFQGNPRKRKGGKFHGGHAGKGGPRNKQNKKFKKKV